MSKVKVQSAPQSTPQSAPQGALQSAPIDISFYTENQIKVIKFLITNKEKDIINTKNIYNNTKIAIKTIRKILSRFREINLITDFKRSKVGQVSGFEYQLNEKLCKKIFKKEVKIPEVLPENKTIKHYTYGEMNTGYYVVKSNKLLEARYKLTLQEKRILLDMISKIQRDDDELCVYRFDAKYLADLTGVKIDGLYKELKLITRRLLKRTLDIHETDEVLQVNWLASAHYKHKKGYVELEFSTKLRPYLLGLKELYKSYQLKNVINLNSFYSIRIYELLKQYEQTDRKSRTFDVEEFKDILKIPKGYKYNNVKKLIINAQQELAEKTDLLFSLTEKKKRQRVVSITFYIEKKGKEIEYENQNNLPSKESELDTLLSIVLEGHREKQSINKLLKESLKNHDVKYIKRNIEYANEQVKDQRKYKTYLDKALKGDWGLDLSEEKSRETKQNLKKQQNEDNKKLVEKLKKEFQNFKDTKRKEAEKNLSETEFDLLKEEFLSNANNIVNNYYKKDGFDSFIVKSSLHVFLEKKFLKSDELDFVKFADSKGYKVIKNRYGDYII